MITIEKEKPAKRELKLFSVEVALAPDVEDKMHLETHISEITKEEYRGLMQTIFEQIFNDDSDEEDDF